MKGKMVYSNIRLLKTQNLKTMKAYSNKTERVGDLRQLFSTWIKGAKAAKKAARQEAKKICVNELNN
jgi:hypothetical protein